MFQVRCTGTDEWLFLCKEFQQLCLRFPPGCQALKGKSGVNRVRDGDVTAIHEIHVVPANCLNSGAGGKDKSKDQDSEAGQSWAPPADLQGQVACVIV